MKSTFLIAGALGAIHFAATAQTNLFSAGNVRIISFGPTNLAFTVLSDSSPGAMCTLLFGADIFGPSDRLKLEFFENSLEEEPVLTMTRTGDFDVGYLLIVEQPGMWQDFQGVVRLTMLSGQVELEQFVPAVVKYGARYSYSEEQQTVPEPAMVPRAGDIYSATVDRFKFYMRVPLPHRPPIPPPEAGVTVILRNGPQLPAGTSLRLDLFENSTAESQVSSQTVQFPLTGAYTDRFRSAIVNGWPDFQGALRITMLNGTAQIDLIAAELYRPSSTPGYVDHYTATIRPAGPHLSIVSVSGGPIQVRWPAEHVGYVLEFNDATVPGDWFPDTNPITMTQGQYSVSIDSALPQRLYRLKRP